MSIKSLARQDLVRVAGRTESSDAEMGRKVSYDFDHSNRDLTCTVCPLSGFVAQQLFMALGVRQPHAVYFSSDPVLVEHDRLRWQRNKAGDFVGTVMRVIGTPQDAHGKKRLWKVLAEAMSADNSNTDIV